jgi:hypothetical protein
MDMLTVAGRYTAADPSKEGDAMSDALTVMLVIFSAMSFVVALLTFVVVLIRTVNKK